MAALGVGSQLGPYVILSTLGEGGMGVVYRARDGRLDREVAIKVAAEPFSERFEREAKAIASLNHVNICHLYDVGPNYLVMEVVEGEPLAGPLAYDEALPLLRQLIDGIEAAHEKGIVHRDLKPANIRLTPEGTVKILDFGLAKALAPDNATTASLDAANSPTLTVDGTRAGTILGTAAYMAPEQARGRTADRRADIWAFGVVAYELLAGAPAFSGESVADILGAVLNQEPDWTRVPVRARPWLQWCLEKDRKQRVQAIGDVRRWLEREPMVVAGPSVPATSSRTAWALAAVVATLTAAVLVWPALTHLRETPPAPPPILRTEISTPPTGTPSSFAVSPDGLAIVFSAAEGRRERLYLRRLDRDTAEPLPDTDDARTPFWSPDSRSIAFVADRRLKRLDLEGGRALPLADVNSDGRGGSWNARGEILFSAVRSPVMLVPASGGTARQVTTLAEGENTHRSPHFLPDGRRFVYSVTGAEDRAGLYLADLDGSAPRRLASLDTLAAYVEPGWLLFLREGALVGQRLDSMGVALAEEVVTIAGRVHTDVSAAFSVSRTGMIAYRRPVSFGRTQLTWFDRTGRPLGVLGDPDDSEIHSPAVSPDGKTVAVSRLVDDNRDIWLIDVTGSRRLTFDPAIDEAPKWSPDGRRLVFQSGRTGTNGLYQTTRTGSGAEVPILVGGLGKVPNSWSPDGRLLVYHEQDQKTARDLFVLPFDGDRPGTPRPLLRTPANEAGGLVSPDGKWLAYVGGGDGGGLHIRSIEDISSQWQVASRVGVAAAPRWSPDGRELYYLNPEDGYLMAVPISPRGNALDIGAPVRLFQPRLPTVRGGGAADQFDVAPDGRFMINVLVDEPTPPSITLIQNWQGGLSAREKQ